MGKKWLSRLLLVVCVFLAAFFALKWWDNKLEPVLGNVSEDRKKVGQEISPKPEKEPFHADTSPRLLTRAKVATERLIFFQKEVSRPKAKPKVGIGRKGSFQSLEKRMADIISKRKQQKSGDSFLRTNLRPVNIPPPKEVTELEPFPEED